MKTVETAPTLDLTLDEVAALSDELAQYHAIFSPLYLRREHRERAFDYLQGLVSPELDRKSVEPIMLALHGADPGAIRSMQQFLGKGAWQDAPILARYWLETDALLGEDDGVLMLDGSDFHKQGKHSVGVKRQYCGELGKTANCQAGVFLGYASRKGYTLLDRRLYVPEEWITGEAFADRRKAVGLPEDLRFQTKPELGIDMIEALLESRRLRARWLVCDEGFGRDGDLLDRVGTLSLCYLAEIPLDARFWIEAPLTELPPWPGKGRKPLRRRLVEGAAPSEPAAAIAARLPEAVWRRYTIKEGSKGPLVADFAFLRATASRGGLPATEQWLLFRRSLSSGEETPLLKAYVSNAPLETPEAELVRVCGMRWPIERCFEESKQMLGMGHYEVRSWVGWHHHMTMVILAHGFLVRMQQQLEKGAPAPA